MPQRNKVCRVNALSKQSLQSKLAVAWGRVCGKMGGPGSFAEKAEIEGSAVSRVLGYKNLPEAHTIFNGLLADPTALDEIMAHYGLRVSPLQAEAANDMLLAASLSDALGEFIRRLSDGKRCHVDTAVLASLFREIIPQMQAIVAEDDARRAA